MPCRLYCQRPNHPFLENLVFPADPRPHLTRRCYFPSCSIFCAKMVSIKLCPRSLFAAASEKVPKSGGPSLLPSPKPVGDTVFVPKAMRLLLFDSGHNSLVVLIVVLSAAGPVPAPASAPLSSIVRVISPLRAVCLSLAQRHLVSLTRSRGGHKTFTVHTCVRCEPLHGPASPARTSDPPTPTPDGKYRRLRSPLSPPASLPPSLPHAVKLSVAKETNRLFSRLFYDG